MKPPAKPYVDHPDFRQRDIAAVLFPPDEPLPLLPPVVHLGSANWRGKKGAGVLTREAEKRRFMQLNYARKRACGPVADRPLWAQRATHLREYLVRMNVTLVPYAVSLRRKRVPNLDAEEVSGDGMAALLRAVDHFNVSAGWRFSSYAVRAILNQFTHGAIRAQRRAARMPTVELYEAAVVVDGSDPVTALAQREEVAKLLRVLADNSAGLTDDERLVLDKRFNGDDRLTHRECTKLLGGCSREGARQLELRALEKLRAVMAA